MAISPATVGARPRPDSFRDMAALAAAQHTPLPPMTPNGTRTFPYRPTITDQMRTTVSQFAAHAHAHADRGRQANTAAGFDEVDHVEESFDYHPGDEITHHDDQFTVRYLYAF